MEALRLPSYENAKIRKNTQIHIKINIHRKQKQWKEKKINMPNITVASWVQIVEKKTTTCAFGFKVAYMD